jgi:hypothetical protein
MFSFSQVEALVKVMRGEDDEYLRKRIVTDIRSDIKDTVESAVSMYTGQIEKEMSDVKRIMLNSPFASPARSHRPFPQTGPGHSDYDFPSPFSPVEIETVGGLGTDAPAGSRPNVQPSWHMDGRDLLYRNIRTTTMSKDGTINEYRILPSLFFDSREDIISHFGAQGWRLEKGNKKSKQGDKLYFNFYCYHGGDSHKHHRRVTKRAAANTNDQVKHRAFGDPRAAQYCCRARLNAIFFPRTGELVPKYSVVGHNHSPSRQFFSFKIAQIAGTMLILDVIQKVAQENPGVRTGELFPKFMSSIDSDYPHHSVRQKESLKNKIGLLRRDMFKDVNELVRRSRGEDLRLDLEYMLQSFMADADERGDHVPRIIGLTWSYDSEAVLHRICIVISTTTMLRRALHGNNQALLIDGTHQTNTAGYKIISFGTEDRWRRFHLIGLAVTTEESTVELESALESLKQHVNEARTDRDPEVWDPRIVMADGSSAITAAAARAFPFAIRLNCFYHIKAGIKARWESHLRPKDYDELQKDVSIISKARSEKQFNLWLSHLMSKWHGNEDVLHYLDANLAGNGWKTRFYWGAGGLLSLTNSRTNNGTESFNKALRNTWFRRSICSLTRLVAILKGSNMEMDSREGYNLDDFDSSDLGSVRSGRLRRHWDEALALLQENIRLVKVKESHFMELVHVDGKGNVSQVYTGTGGEVFAFGFRDEEEVKKLLDGDFNPFVHDRIGCVTFVPLSAQEVLLPPPNGSLCTCESFIQTNWCGHILFVLTRTHRCELPLGLVRVGQAVRSHGIRRPREPNHGSRNCMKRLDNIKGRKRAKGVTKKSHRSPSVVCSPENMVTGTLFLAWRGTGDARGVDVFSYRGRLQDGRISANVYWYDEETDTWQIWEQCSATILIKDIICTHFCLEDSRVPAYVQEHLRLDSAISSGVSDVET